MAFLVPGKTFLLICNVPSQTPVCEVSLGDDCSMEGSMFQVPGVFAQSHTAVQGNSELTRANFKSRGSGNFVYRGLVMFELVEEFCLCSCC